MALAEALAMTSLLLTSPAFKNGDPIPADYTCDGKDISPPFQWSEPPAGTQSFALIADDPDAPGGIWVHWVVYNIPTSLRELKKGVPADTKLKDGTLQGRNDFSNIGYGGPCPPGGTHHYYFKLFALDVSLSLAPGATKNELEQAMKGHILAESHLMGPYRRR